MAKSFKKFTPNNAYKQIFLTVTSSQIISAFEAYNMDAFQINMTDFQTKDKTTYRNNYMKLKLVEADEYKPFKLSFKKCQTKKNIKEPANRMYVSDINILFRLYKEVGDDKQPDTDSPNQDILALKIISEAYMHHMESLISEGWIWKAKDKKIKRQEDGGITVVETGLTNFMQVEDKEGNELDNPIAYVSFGNKNQLERKPQEVLVDDEGNVVKYQCSGNPDFQIFELNVKLVKVNKGNSKFETDPKYRNPETNKLENYTNATIQHLITYNSLLTGTIKFQIVGSAKGFKLSAFFDNVLYVMKNAKVYNGSSIDLSIIQDMQSSKEAAGIEGSDEENDEDDDTEFE